MGRIIIQPASFRKPVIHRGTDVLMHSTFIKSGGMRIQREAKALSYVSIHIWDICNSFKNIKLLIFPKYKYIYKCCSMCLQNSVIMCTHTCTVVKCSHAVFNRYGLSKQCSLSPEDSGSIFYFRVFIGKWKDNNGKPYFQKSNPNHLH